MIRAPEDRKQEIQIEIDKLEKIESLKIEKSS